MNADGAAIVSASLAALVLIVALSRVNRSLPPSIVRRLLAGRHEVVVRRRIVTNMGLWNPAKPYQHGSLIFGRGVAAYSLLDDQVVLRWRPRRGMPLELAGPIPAPFHPSNTSRRRSLRRPVAGYVMLLSAVGVILGFASGMPLLGVDGALVTACILPLLAISLRGRRQRRTARTADLITGS